MGIGIRINQLDYSQYLQASTYDENEIIGGERGKITFSLHRVPFALRPLANMVVGLYDQGKNPGAPGTIVEWAFEGLILTTKNVNIGLDHSGNEVLSYSLECTDATDPFYQQYVTDSYENKYTGFIIRDMVKRKCPQIDVSQVPDGTKIHSFFGVELELLTKCLDSLCAAEGYQWYIKGNQLLIGQPAQNLYPLVLDDANLHNIGGVKIEIDPEDASQIRNVINYEYIGKIIDGKAEVNTGTTFVRYWSDTRDSSYKRYIPNSAWSSEEPAGVFYIPGLLPLLGQPGRYTVAGVNSVTGNLTLGSAFAENTSSGLVEASPAPTYKTMRTKATSAIMVTAFDRAIAGSWITVTVTGGIDQSRYIKAVTKTGTGTPAVGNPYYYDFVFGDGNPTDMTSTFAGTPALAPDAPGGALVPIADPAGVIGTTNYWSMLENYIWTDIPSRLVVQDPISIEALKRLLYDPSRPLNQQDTGVREDVMTATTVMTFQEAYARAYDTLNQYSNPLVNFKIDTTSWQLARLGITTHPLPAMGVMCNITQRGIVGVQTIKAVRKRPGGINPDGTMMWRFTIDFADRLFYLHNIIRRIKEDLPRVYVDRKSIRDVFVVNEVLLGQSNTNLNNIVSISENYLASDPVVFPQITAAEIYTLGDTPYVGVSIPVAEAMDGDDVVTLYAKIVLEAYTLGDSALITHAKDGPSKYGYSKFGWSDFWPA